MKKLPIALGAILVIVVIVVVVKLSKPPVQPGNSGNYNGEVEVKRGLVVENIKAGDTVSSPLQITGYVNGEGWNGFEGQVGTVSLQDNTGNELDIEPLTATTEWMTTTVRFETNLEFTTNATEGKLVFRNENASGEPSRDKTVTIPVKFALAGETMNLQAYFTNSRLDPEVTCEKVFPVTRTVPRTTGVARAALEELFKGPTNAEKTAGYQTSIAGGKINSLTIVDGVAKADFHSAIEDGVAGSCRVTAIRSQITHTLKQFPTVKSVIISVDGKMEGIFQP